MAHIMGPYFTPKIEPQAQVTYGLEDGEEVSAEHLETCKQMLGGRIGNRGMNGEVAIQDSYSCP